MKPKEWYFYAAVAAAVAFNELSIHIGFLYCLAFPALLVVVAIGLWVLEK
ncbi:MAG TPA: hypothetical protein PLV64_22935 [Anaerolineales bacterium]|nr:hypothetical protein [Anaerolineales bacterium]